MSGQPGKGNSPTCDEGSIPSQALRMVDVGHLTGVHRLCGIEMKYSWAENFSQLIRWRSRDRYGAEQPHGADTPDGDLWMDCPHPDLHTMKNAGPDIL